jgi:hypothetical protein
MQGLIDDVGQYRNTGAGIITKNILPLTQYQSLPQTPHSAIAICKWMNKFKFIMKYRAKNEWMFATAPQY